MNAMYTLVLTHESVCVAAYTEEFLLYFVTHCLQQWKMKQYTERESQEKQTYFTALSSVSPAPVIEYAFYPLHMERSS